MASRRGRRDPCPGARGADGEWRRHAGGVLEPPDARADGGGAGTYVYGDRSCIANGTASLEDCALRVRATVVSRPTPDRAILDAGSKTLTNDPAEGDPGGRGLIVEHPDARIHALSEEHGWVDLSSCSGRPEVGEVVTVIPNHACGCANLHDEVVLLRDGQVVGVWPVAVRGRIR